MLPWSIFPEYYGTTLALLSAMARRRRASPCEPNPTASRKRIRVEKVMPREDIAESNVSVSSRNATHGETLDIIKVENEGCDYSSHVDIYPPANGGAAVSKVPTTTCLQACHPELAVRSCQDAAVVGRGGGASPGPGREVAAPQERTSSAARKQA
ncbi:hypothetical protein L596_004426 [Steinernema carpocapsae]|uniref:Uncharacterized protein n=1 Tax=Steinernema carpocapsae TaxID=34508 RepID=A0A4U8UVY4_STECR|nr:hypothetical protein L596_004426 [Steinernema carpocapsae]